VFKFSLSWRFGLNNTSLKDFNDYQHNSTFIRVLNLYSDFQLNIRYQLLNFHHIKVVHVTSSLTINLLVKREFYFHGLVARLYYWVFSKKCNQTFSER